MTADPAPAVLPPAPLYMHDGGEVECVADTYVPGHSSTLFHEAKAHPRKRLLWTDRGTWMRVTAADVAEWNAMPGTDATPLTCEVCGRGPLT